MLLSLPSSLNLHTSQIFEGIRWSSEHTLQDQVRNITLVGHHVSHGGTYTDVDTIEDVQALLSSWGNLSACDGEFLCDETFRLFQRLLEEAKDSDAPKK